VVLLRDKLKCITLPVVVLSADAFAILSEGTTGGGTSFPFLLQESSAMHTMNMKREASFRFDIPTELTAAAVIRIRRSVIQ